MRAFDRGRRARREAGDRSTRVPRRADVGAASDEFRKTGSEHEDLCWGRNPVLSLLEDFPSRCAKVLVSKTTQRTVFERIATLCRKADIPFLVLEPRIMDDILKGENHQGVIAVVLSRALLGFGDALEKVPPRPNPALTVLLDHVQDPRNLGAMIRSAEAAGASFVALPLRRASLPTGTVLKTSAGASLRLPVVSVGNVANAVRDFQAAGFWTVGLDAGAKRSIFSEPLPPRTLLVVGGESKGLASTTEKACDETVCIPICGSVGSLNASIALAIGMFEWAKGHFHHEDQE